MTIELVKKLVAIASVTPEDGGCQRLLAERLAKCGFKAEHLRYEDVDNLWLTHGSGSPVFAFLGHTDVVPPGPAEEWQSDPFTATERDGYLYGRGTADMKGSIAAMVTAMERFVGNNPDHTGTLAILLTSDEEGVAINGTQRVVEYLQENNISIDWCLVGEPSSREVVGDIIKNGRRGSLTGELTVYGIQGHVAYPDMAENPIHLVIPALNELCNTGWDGGNEHYPPTRFQISNIHAGTGASNVIPGTVEINFNFRYSTEVTEEELKRRTGEALDKLNLKYEINWLPSSKPFLTGGGVLLESVQQSIVEKSTGPADLSTDGGTSDGRFIAPTGAEVAELGPVNATIHKVNECVKIADLELLSEIYESILGKLFRG